MEQGVIPDLAAEVLAEVAVEVAAEVAAEIAGGTELNLNCSSGNL